MLDRNDIETRKHEANEAQAERVWQSKMHRFAADPYAHAEWHIDAFDKYVLLDLALAHPDALALFDMDSAVAHTVSKSSVEAMQEALKHCVEEVEF